ncbi:hypothetical protein, partial [Pectobacterium parmentieri]|uniref:hypothetical protein n=2 Tax=Pectobacterium parmentieri TaxID=1905730 RepID=UPI001E34BADE
MLVTIIRLPWPAWSFQPLSEWWAVHLSERPDFPGSRTSTDTAADRFDLFTEHHQSVYCMKDSFPLIILPLCSMAGNSLFKEILGKGNFRINSNELIE